MIILDEQETPQSSSSGGIPPPATKSSNKTDSISTSSPVINTSPPPPPYTQHGHRQQSPSSPSYPYFNQPTAHHHHHSRPHHGYHPRSHHTYHPIHNHSQPTTPIGSPTTPTHPSGPNATATTAATSTAVEDHPLVVHYRVQHELEKRALKRFFAAFLIALVILTLSSTFVRLVASAAIRSGRQRVHATAVQGEEVTAASAVSSHRASAGTASIIPNERILSIAYPPPS